jgi:hypothetical protein
MCYLVCHLGRPRSSVLWPLPGARPTVASNAGARWRHGACSLVEWQDALPHLAQMFCFRSDRFTGCPVTCRAPVGDILGARHRGSACHWSTRSDLVPALRQSVTSARTGVERDPAGAKTSLYLGRWLPATGVCGRPCMWSTTWTRTSVMAYDGSYFIHRIDVRGHHVG